MESRLVARMGYDIRTMRGNEGGELRLVHHRVAQNADLRRRDLHHVTGLEPHRGTSVHAGAGRGSGPDQVAGLERREGADVVDQPGKAPGQTVGAVVLP